MKISAFFAAIATVTTLGMASVSAHAVDFSQATAVRLISMPGPDGTMQLVDVGVMPDMPAKGTLIMLCDAQCQGVLHLVGKPASNGKGVAMGLTLYVDAHTMAAKLLGGH